jgi:hypothetical protein
MSYFPASLAVTEDLRLPTQEYFAAAASRLVASVVSLGLHCSYLELSRHRLRLRLVCPSHCFLLQRESPRARVADRTSFANGLATSSRARRPALRVRPGCSVLHRRQLSCRAGETRARRSRRDFGERQRRDCGVGDSTVRFSVGLSCARDVDVLYIWEQPRSIPTSRQAVGMLHGLGGRLGGHSSLQFN